MAEAVGLAIGAIGLVPPTVALLNCCADFYKDLVRTDQVSKELSLKFEELASRYDSTQKLLFEEKKFDFAPRGLFKELSQRNQKIIRAMLQELPRLLYSFYSLEKCYRSKQQPETPWRENFVLSSKDWNRLFDDNVKPPKAEKTSLFASRGWTWTIRGKARAERLLVDFEDWIRRIRSLIEDAWYPLSPLQLSSNLQSVENDKDAKSLGVAQPAKLRKLVLLESVPGLEIKKTKLQIQQLSARRGLSTLNGEAVLVEMLPYPVDSDGFMPKMLENRFSTIAGLLQQAQDPDFLTLRCMGYIKCTFPSPQLQLVYRTPEVSTQPLTLLQKLTTSESIKPSLGARFRLAHRLALSLSLMHSVGWIHRGLRSDNILLFPSISSEERSYHASFGLGNPKLSGFEASRLESDFSSGPYDNEISLDVYRHPHRWGTPKKPFNKYHDIYALGVVLLELGLWEPALRMGGNDFRKGCPNRDQLALSAASGTQLDLPSRPSSRASARSPTPEPAVRSSAVAKESGTSTPKQQGRSFGPATSEAVTKELLYQADMRLGHRCGESYRRIVHCCLTGEFDVEPEEETKLETVLQGHFREMVVEVLEGLYQSVD